MMNWIMMRTMFSILDGKQYNVGDGFIHHGGHAPSVHNN